MELTLEQLKKETCQSYGGNNCVLHGCMFECALQAAMRKLLSENKTTHE